MSDQRTGFPHSLAGPHGMEIAAGTMAIGSVVPGGSNVVAFSDRGVGAGFAIVANDIRSRMARDQFGNPPGDDGPEAA